MVVAYFYKKMSDIALLEPLPRQELRAIRIPWI